MASANPYSGGTYSFADIQGSIMGPGGSCDIGYTSGPSEEGVSVAMLDEKTSMQIGAGGFGMFSLHAGKAARIQVRLLKTSPANATLNQMYRFDTASSANAGQNIIKFRNPVRGDTVTCQLCAFAKHPDINYGKEGGMNEWTFLSIVTDQILGDGTPG